MLGDNFDIALYREALETVYLPAEKFGLDPTSPEYESLIDRYLFDGMKLGEIANYIESQPDRKSVRFEPSPEEVFVEYRFDKKVDAEFDVDAPGNLGSAPAFQDGKAIDPALQAGKKIGFAKDETIIVDQLTADGYQRSNGQAVPPFSTQYPVTELDRYYFRQMRDYPFMLSDLKRQVDRFTQEIARAQVNNKVAEDSLNDALEQSRKRGEIIVKLDQDRQNLQRDLATITQLFNERTTQLADMQQRSRQLDLQIENQYKAIQSAAAVLKKVTDTE